MNCVKPFVELFAEPPRPCVLMPVEDDLNRKRRIPAHPDGDMVPFAVHDVEEVVPHERTWVLAADVPSILNVPQRCLCAADQDKKDAFLNLC